jgi:hypothetical protein
MPALLSYLPDLIVEFAPTNTPLETAPTWVDISSYVLANPQITTQRGRTREGTYFPHGTMSLTLSNRDRRFDPLYAAGPYFGNLRARKQIRVRAVWSATSYTIFTGWVTGWPQDYAEGRVDATVEIQCVDALAWLAEAGMTIDLFATVGSPIFHLSDFDGTTWVDRIAGNNALPTAAPTDQPQPSFLPFEGAGRSCQTVSGRGVRQLATPLTGYSAFTVSFWIKSQTLSSVTDATSVILAPPASLPSVSAILATSNIGPYATLTIVVADGSGNNVTFNEIGGVLADGGPHLVTLVVSSAFNVKVYIDAALQREGSSGVGTPALSLSKFCTGSTANGDSTVLVQEIAVWGSELTAAQIVAWYQVGYGKVIEPTTTRVTRILDNIAWPAAWRTLPPTSGLGAARGEVSDVQQTGFALNALRDVEASEQGRLFASKANFVTLQARYDAFETTRGNTVQATFSDDGTGIGYTSIGWDYEDRDVTNDVMVDWSDGSQRSTDSTSITAVGRQSQTINTVLSTKAQATDMAAGVVQFRKDEKMRTRAIRVMPANGAHWATVLNLEIGDRISVKITPMGVGAQITQTLTLEAISWSIVGAEWAVDLFGTPIPTDVFVLDSSLLDTGRLGY